VKPHIPENSIKVPLHPHQYAVLERIEALEQGLNTGLTVKNEILFANCGILGDSVGVGKSLMVLAHIARISAMAKIDRINLINNTGLPNIFSVKTLNYLDSTEAGCLIIVPHTLFRQWVNYIKEQTNLKAMLISKVEQVDSNDFVASVMAADVVLVSNTLCKNFIPRCRSADIRWKRLFIDEADTIHLPGVYHTDFLQIRFIWFITASWVNLLYLNAALYFNRSDIQHHIFSDNTIKEPDP
jgi:hypothetical protein